MNIRRCPVVQGVGGQALSGGFDSPAIEALGAIFVLISLLNSDCRVTLVGKVATGLPVVNQA
jgi:hypothetical protein